jgi:hypothetical protein
MNSPVSCRSVLWRSLTCSAAATGALVVGCASSSPPPTAGTPTAPVSRHRARVQAPRPASGAGIPTCHATLIRYIGGSGATQHLGANFVVSTESSRPCSIIGFPAVTLLDRRGRALPSVPHHVNGLFGLRLRRTLVTRTHDAGFALWYMFADPSGAHLCAPIAAALRVRLPGNGATVVVPLVTDPSDTRVVNPCDGRFDLSPVA